MAVGLRDRADAAIRYSSSNSGVVPSLNLRNLAVVNAQTRFAGLSGLDRIACLADPVRHIRTGVAKAPTWWRYASIETDGLPGCGWTVLFFGGQRRRNLENTKNSKTLRNCRDQSREA